MRKTTPEEIAIWFVLFLLLVGIPTTGGTTGNAPFKTDKLSVLIVEQPVQRRDYTAGQLAVVNSNAPDSVREYCKTNGNPLQILDVDHTDLGNAPQWIKDAFELCKGKELPCIVAANARTGFGPMKLPDTEYGTKEALQKLGL